MAKAKEKPKSLFALKGDFNASLDNVCHEGIMLIQAIEMALRADKIQGEAGAVLKERAAAFRAALATDE